MIPCPMKVRLRDYGDALCRLRAGHDGHHVATSPYDSRDIKWATTPENVECRTVPDENDGQTYGGKA